MKAMALAARSEWRRRCNQIGAASKQSA